MYIFSAFMHERSFVFTVDSDFRSISANLWIVENVARPSMFIYT